MKSKFRRLVSVLMVICFILPMLSSLVSLVHVANATSLQTHTVPWTEMMIGSEQDNWNVSINSNYYIIYKNTMEGAYPYYLNSAPENSSWYEPWSVSFENQSWVDCSSYYGSLGGLETNGTLMVIQYGILLAFVSSYGNLTHYTISGFPTNITTLNEDGVFTGGYLNITLGEYSGSEFAAQWIANGGFETGDDSGWYGGSVSTTINTTDPHSGFYCLSITNQTGSTEGQAFPVTIPVNNVSSFVLYARTNGASSVNVYVKVHYTDYSTSIMSEVVYTSWSEINVTSSLTSGKIISYFNVYATDANFSIDDASMLTFGASLLSPTYDLNIIAKFANGTAISSGVHFTENGTAEQAPYNNEVAQNHYLLEDLNTSYHYHQFLHWYVVFQGNGTQVMANSTASSILVPCYADIRVTMIYNSTILSYEGILNGGFETGSFIGWSIAGNYYGQAVPVISTNNPHSGAFCCKDTPTGDGGGSIQQGLAISIPVSQITSFSLWYAGYAYGSSDSGHIRITYNDASYTDILIPNEGNYIWYQINILSQLDISKSVSSILVQIGYSSFVSSDIYIDDVSLMSTFTPTLFNYINYTPSTGGSVNLTSGLNAYVNGSIAHLVETPNDYYTFVHWIVNGTVDGTESQLNLTMNANYSLTTKFYQRYATFSSGAYSHNLDNFPCKFSMNITDSSGISGYILSICNNSRGVFYNGSWTSGSNATEVHAFGYFTASNFSQIIYKFYTNDSGNYWSVSDAQYTIPFVETEIPRTGVDETRSSLPYTYGNQRSFLSNGFYYTFSMSGNLIVYSYKSLAGTSWHTITVGLGIEVNRLIWNETNPFYNTTTLHYDNNTWACYVIGSDVYVAYSTGYYAGYQNPFTHVWINASDGSTAWVLHGAITGSGRINWGAPENITAITIPAIEYLDPNNPGLGNYPFCIFAGYNFGITEEKGSNGGRIVLAFHPLAFYDTGGGGVQNYFIYCFETTNHGISWSQITYNAVSVAGLSYSSGSISLQIDPAYKYGFMLICEQDSGGDIYLAYSRYNASGGWEVVGGGETLYYINGYNFQTLSYDLVYYPTLDRLYLAYEGRGVMYMDNASGSPGYNVEPWKSDSPNPFPTGGYVTIGIANGTLFALATDGGNIIYSYARNNINDLWSGETYVLFTNTVYYLHAITNAGGDPLPEVMFAKKTGSYNLVFCYGYVSPSTTHILNGGVLNLDCDNWIITETKYYSFFCNMTITGAYPLQDVMFNFTDVAGKIVTVYYNNITRTAMFFANGSICISVDEANATTIEGVGYTLFILSVFPKSALTDSWSADVHFNIFANTTYGASDTLEISNVFNIYSKGGLNKLTDVVGTSENGAAGKVVGGDVFNVFCGNLSYARVDEYWLNLVDVHFLVACKMTQTSSGAYLGLQHYIFGINYFARGEWVNGFTVQLTPIYMIDQDSNPLQSGEKWSEWDVALISRDILISDTTIYAYHVKTQDYTEFWIDMWFNKANDSSVCGIRVTPYFYGVSTNDPWSLFTGGGWAPSHTNQTCGMMFATLQDENYKTLFSQEIRMVDLWGEVSQDLINVVNTVSFGNFKSFDMTYQYGMTGIDTPQFEEPRTPAVPLGGIPGLLSSWIAELISALSPVFHYAWSGVVWVLDNVLAFVTGRQGVFSGFCNMLSSIIGSIVSFMGYIAAQFVNFVTVITNVLTWFFGTFFGAIWGFIYFVFINPAFNIITAVTSIFAIAFAWLGGTTYTNGWGQVYDFTYLSRFSFMGLHGGIVVFAIIFIFGFFIQILACLSTLSLAPIMEPVHLFVGFVMFTVNVIETIFNIVYRVIHVLVAAAQALASLIPF